MKNLVLLLMSLFACEVYAATMPEAGKVYTILSKQYAGMYMSEEADGTIVVGSFDNARRQFWEFIPTGASGCYYIRNKVSGRYIQSCNGTNSSSSVMHTGANPVEYYVGLSTTGSNQGFFWLSSTDCSGYNDQSTSPHGLNKDGASNHVIIWMAGTGNNGSHWSIQETDYAYEIHPFTPSADLAHPGVLYHLVHDGQYVSSTLDLVQAQETEELSWYFVGQSNATGGYQIVNAATHVPAQTSEGGHAWIVNEDAETGTFYFTSATDASERFLFAGESLLSFKLARSSFARHAQIYDIPCGALSGSMYVSAASLAGEGISHKLTYPIRTQSGTVRSSTAQTVAPTTWYKLNVIDQAVVRRGRSLELSLTLSKAPTGGEAVFVYFDWNRDGVFETAYTLPVARTMTETVDVPAEAALGASRMRVRVTYNGLADAEDEVQGQCIDFVLQTIDDDGLTDFTVTARPNDATRGTAEIVGDTAKATNFAGASFICWKEGARYVSVSKNYRYGTLTHNLQLTAVFAADVNDPYGENVISGLHSATVVSTTAPIEIDVMHGEVVAKTTATLQGMALYNLEGVRVRQSGSARMDVSGLPAGIYVVKAYTDSDAASVKFSVK
ncbi:MAG: T9SS type A sorting domain-containing protein [Bacteroidaceae bacterium]|nr:T9SS type A sorting domain-containing protein [Bacteroidaceae bacterium]